MNYTTILVEKNQGICKVTLNRPDKLNAFNPIMNSELCNVLKDAETDRNIRVLVLTGSGRAFCSGADLNWFKEDIASQERGEKEEHLARIHLGGPMAFHNMPKPTICAINGHAVGLGFTLALACDIRLASENAKLGAIFAQVGLVPEFGSTYLLPRLIGIAKACELVFTAKMITAQEAKDMGVVNQVVPGEELEKAALEMAKAIVKMPPQAIELAKRGMYQGLDSDFNTQVEFETLALSYCFKSEDHAEAVKAFLEKRPAVFKGR